MDVEGAGPAVRVAGIEDLQLSDGRTLRAVSMQVFVQAPGRQLLVLTASSPCVHLADDLLGLFDAVRSTLVLGDAAEVVGA